MPNAPQNCRRANRAKTNADQQEDRGGYRGRRRRGPRRGPDGTAPKYSRPTESAPRPERESSSRALPGGKIDLLAGTSPSFCRGPESILQISEVEAQRRKCALRSVVALGGAQIQLSRMTSRKTSRLFAQNADHESEVSQDLPLAIEEPTLQAELRRERDAEPSFTSNASNDWDREQKRLHQKNVAEMFGGDEAAEEDDSDAENTFTAVSEHFEKLLPKPLRARWNMKRSTKRRPT